MEAIKLTKREKEIIYFALSRLLDTTANMDREAKAGDSEGWNKVDALRDRFYVGDEMPTY